MEDIGNSNAYRVEKFLKEDQGNYQNVCYKIEFQQQPSEIEEFGYEVYVEDCSVFVKRVFKTDPNNTENVFVKKLSTEGNESVDINHQIYRTLFYVLVSVLNFIKTDCVGSEVSIQRQELQGKSNSNTEKNDDNESLSSETNSIADDESQASTVLYFPIRKYVFSMPSPPNDANDVYDAGDYFYEDSQCDCSRCNSDDDEEPLKEEGHQDNKYKFSVPSPSNDANDFIAAMKYFYQESECNCSRCNDNNDIDPPDAKTNEDLPMFNYGVEQEKSIDLGEIQDSSNSTCKRKLHDDDEDESWQEINTKKIICSDDISRCEYSF